MNMESMFSSGQRKCPSSLYTLCEVRLKRLILSLLHPDHVVLNSRTCGSFSALFRSHLPPHIRHSLLDQMVQLTSNGLKEWQLSCSVSKSQFCCRIHKECVLAYRRMPQLLSLLHCSDFAEVSVNFKRVHSDLHKKVLDQLFTCSRLSKLCLTGSTVQTDCQLETIELLTRQLANKKTVNLTSITLVVGSNHVLAHLSRMPLHTLIIERPRKLTYRGLDYISSDRSVTKHTLRLFCLGVYQHRMLAKLDVSKFLSKMPGLTSFSLMEEDRFVGYNQSGFLGRLFAYSALKLAIVNHTFRNQNKSDYFTCDLKEINVVDSDLTPEYLLDSCPQLTKLYLDWHYYMVWKTPNGTPNTTTSSWFSAMIRSGDWRELLLTRLEQLHIVFPAAHDFMYGYSLGIRDWDKLCPQLCNLSKLTLSGAGLQEPIPILELLKTCRKMRHLTLDKTDIYISDPQDGLGDNDNISTSLTHFRLTRYGRSMAMELHYRLPQALQHFMPNLEELVLEPDSVFVFEGIKLEMVLHLASLHRLQRLSLALSMAECVMNMPEVVYVLKDFKALRFLTLSWCSWVDTWGNGRVAHLTNWLENTLKAENANIHLQLCYNTHANIFTNPPDARS